MSDSIRSNNKLTYRPDVDGLRAVAVLSAVFFHFFPEWRAGGGFIGPEVFFVISGFLISTILFNSIEKGSFTFRDFYGRRIRRVFPALLVVLIFCWIVGWFVLLADEYQQLGKHIAAGAGFASNFMLWKEAGYFDAAAERKILLHLWTLAIEEQFYLLWPFLLWLAYRTRIHLLVVTCIGAAISFYLNIRLVAHDAEGAFYLPQSRFWELASGALLAWLVLHKDLLSQRLRLFAPLSAGESLDNFCKNNARLLSNMAALCGAALLAFGFYRIKASFKFPGYWAIVPVLATVLMIAAGPRAWLNRVVLSNRLLVGIGLISYPFYLWHWPLLVFLRVSVGELPDLKWRFVLVVISLLLAWGTYLFIEGPARKTKFKLATTWLLNFSMIAIGVLGYEAYRHDGFKSRFPEVIEALTQPMNMHHWYDNLRLDKCYLLNAEQLQHAPVCYETKRPLLALWGDSHAAALYPGFRKLQDEFGFGIMQLTQSSCGPIFDLETLTFSAHCNEINRRILQDMMAAQPDVLVLHAAWSHPHYPLSTEALYNKFSATIRTLKADLPHSRLIIIGAMPRWNDSPQKTSFLYWKNSLDKTVRPPVLQRAILLDDVDKTLEKVARENNVEFISASKALCEGTSCLSRVGDTAEDFIAVDYAHCSTRGAEFFVKAIWPQLNVQSPSVKQFQ